MTQAIEAAWRSDRAAIVGSLARRFGDLDLAEEAVQEAFLAAETSWGDTPPDRPGAWLQTTAFRKAVGILRKRRPAEQLDDDAVKEALDPDTGERPQGWDGDDDLFALLVTCCHPSLSAEASIALTLRHVAGLHDDQIASLFLAKPATITKRLVRARRKIVDAAISFEPPTGDPLVDRMHNVRRVIYLMFTEGYLPTAKAELHTELCDEAIWLGRQLLRAHPSECETLGLVALMLLQNSRAQARIDEDGALVRFDEQDRALWDRDAINEARTLLSRTGHQALGKYQVEAAIALCHVAGDEPDWARIADLYVLLAQIDSSIAVAVNRALAVGRADGAPAGLALLDELSNDPTATRYVSWHACRGDLLGQLGDHAASRSAWLEAAELTDNPTERTALLKRANDAHTPPST